MTDTDPLDRVRQALARPSRPSSDFDLNAQAGLPRPRTPRTLRPAGVLAAIRDGAAGPEVLLTVRSSRLRHHPGQIAFPGGKVDPGDADPVAAALREAHEEIGLPPGAVEVWGTLSAHETVTGYAVTPVVGRVTRAFAIRPEPGEVDEVFVVPLAHLENPASYRVESRRWRGTRRHYYVVPFGPYYIWGATARMLRGLSQGMVDAAEQD